MTSELDQLYELRKKRLRELIERDYRSITALCDKIGKKSSYLSQLFTGARAFTEKMARDIEDKAGLPPGWLDQAVDAALEPATAASSTATVIAREVKDLDDRDQVKVLLYVRELLIAKYRPPEN